MSDEHGTRGNVGNPGEAPSGNIGGTGGTGGTGGAGGQGIQGVPGVPGVPGKDVDSTVLADFVETMGALVVGLDRVATEVQRDRNSRRGLLVVLALLVLGAMAAITVGMSILKRTNNLVEGNNNYGARLVDCTTPGGKCYEHMQQIEADRTASGEASRIAASDRIINGSRDPNGNGIPDVWELAEALGTPISTTTTTIVVP